MSQDISQLSDEALAEHIRADNPEEYREIVLRYEARLLRYVQGILHDADKAADVVQETFIKAFINLNGFNTKLKFSSWIYRIAHNEAINSIRKYAKEFRPDDEAWFDRVEDERELLPEAMDKEISKQQLASSLSKLSLKYRDPVMLHYLEGLSYQEISDVLTIPVATVGTRINRGKGQLKTILRKEGFGA